MRAARRIASRAALAVAVAVATPLVGCGPKAAFTLSSSVDNDRGSLDAALARRALPARPQPVNASGQPRLFASIGGSHRGLIAYDLAAGKALWKVDAELASRVAVGGDFVVALEAKAVVARDQATGAVRWQAPVADTFGGVAADAKRAYLVHGDGGDPGTWTLVGLDGATGKELWKVKAAGRLGAPEAHGGLVYAPFQHQWLTLVDGATGKELSRLRGLDEQLALLRVTSVAGYIGSKNGVYLIDGRATAGKPADATFVAVSLPAQLEQARVARDHYDPIMLGYSAADRARVLWQADVAGAKLRFAGDGFVVHYFRFLFGYGADGALRWAYSHPRVELVASDHTGAVVVGVSAQGEIVALDPRTGAARGKGNLAAGGPIVGATFDADGWAPTGGGEPAATVPALVAIAHDRDARFEKVKELAIAALAGQPGAEVTRDLLGVLDDDRASLHLKEAVVERLIARKDAGSLPVLTTSLAVHTDYIAGKEPEALASVARAISGLAGVALPASEVAPAVAALVRHLDAPATTVPELVEVIGALAAIGGGAEQPALISHLLLYHVDEEVGAEPGWGKAIVAAVLGHGGPAGRQQLGYVANDPRTPAALAALVKEALAKP